MQTFLHKTGVSAKKADQDAGTGIAISGLVPIFRSASLEDKHSKKEDVRGVEKVSNRDQPRAPREPRPSEALKPNGKSIRTDSYSMARPALLGEVTKIIDDGIKRLQRSGSKNDDERLEVYREAFQKFIDEFNIYRPVLMSVKREYDSRLSGLREKLTTYSSYDSEMAVKEQETINKIRNIQHYSEIKIQQVTDRARDLEMTVLKLESEKKLLQTELQQSEEVNMRLSNDCDEMRNTCVTLTNSLSRLEEERRISKALESTMSSEISNLKFSEGKANEEIER